MQRRGGSGQPVKGQSANRPKARNAPTAQVSTADLQEQLDRLTRERERGAGAADRDRRRFCRSSAARPSTANRCSRRLLEMAARLCAADIANMYSLRWRGFCIVSLLQTLVKSECENMIELPVAPRLGSGDRERCWKRNQCTSTDIRADPEYESGRSA